MSALRKARIEQIALYLGRGQSPSYIDFETNTFAINQKCIRDGKVDSLLARAHDSKVAIKREVILQPGDICINSTGTGTAGRIGLWLNSSEELYFADSHVTIFRPNPEVFDSKFLATLLQTHSVQTDLETFCFSGSTNQVELNRSAVLNLELQVLSLPEQQLIAKIFTLIERAIEQTEALIAKQQRIKTGLMQDLLTKGIDEYGNIRSEATHEFKESPLGRIPKEWDVIKLDEELLAIEQGWSPDCEPFPAQTGEWGVLKTTAVVWEGYNDSENKRLPHNLKPKTQYEVRTGDILMTRGGPNSRVGVVVYVGTTQSKLMLSDKLYRLAPSNAFEPAFLVLSLSSSYTQRHLSTLKTGLAESQTNISQEIVRNLLTVKPPKDEQALIVKIAKEIEVRLAKDTEELYKQRKLKTGLMQDLLTGKVGVESLLAEQTAVSA